MPNIVNKLTVQEFAGEVEQMGSCIVVGFDKMTVAQAEALRGKFRNAGVGFHVLKNRLAVKVFEGAGYALPKLVGKCGVVFAPEEKAITAAKLVREFQTENKELALEVLAGIVEGEVLAGGDAKMIADMPDKQTVRGQLAGLLMAPGRGIAVSLSGLGSGLARCLQQRADGEGGGNA
ncbi:MAG: 50S ribosomal protein L10 [Planctomycetes bacterium]|nr:50S ribosomal protein L10 [Planctomycetota bacterium]MCB9890750.1 50S ribosomal protein L10 [Planctomycetota bacterium]MCB9917300.1 50S ribosomal protein L10 [Planctomycetota bacterium]